MYGNNSCALYFWDNKIAMNGVDSCGSEYRKGSIKHELGHAIDLMHDKLTNSRLHKYNFGGNSIDSFYIKCSNDLSLKNKYLRKYSYTDSMEFWADLFAYDLKNLKIDNSLSQIRDKAINQYNKVYIENRNKWNAIKEQYK